MATSLDKLKATGTIVVSDSGDFDCEWLSRLPCLLRVQQAQWLPGGSVNPLGLSFIPVLMSWNILTNFVPTAIAVYKPQDATTNPVSTEVVITVKNHCLNCGRSTSSPSFSPRRTSPHIRNSSTPLSSTESPREATLMPKAALLLIVSSSNSASQSWPLSQVASQQKSTHVCPSTSRPLLVCISAIHHSFPRLLG